jgi:hypothetical protein
MFPWRPEGVEVEKKTHGRPISWSATAIGTFDAFRTLLHGIATLGSSWAVLWKDLYIEDEG